MGLLGLFEVHIKKKGHLLRLVFPTTFQLCLYQGNYAYDSFITLHNKVPYSFLLFCFLVFLKYLESQRHANFLST